MGKSWLDVMQMVSCAIGTTFKFRDLIINRCCLLESDSCFCLFLVPTASSCLPFLGCRRGTPQTQRQALGALPQTQLDSLGCLKRFSESLLLQTSIALDLFCFIVLFVVPLAVPLSVFNDIGEPGGNLRSRVFPLP